MFGRVMALVIKEFLALLRDKQGRFILIGPPIIQLIVFGYAATFDLKDVPYAVYDEDRSPVSRELIAHFAGSKAFEKIADILDEASIRSIIDNQKALMVIHIGRNFGRDIMKRRPAPVQVIIDGRNSNTAMLSLNYVNEIVERFNEDLAAQYGIGKSPARLYIRAWFNENLESRWFIVPGIVGLLTLVVTLTVTALSIAREREAGTFDQLLVTPLSPFEILLGKTIPGMIIGILEGTFIIFVTIYWFGIPLRGSIIALYLGLVLFILSAIGMGLMISSFAVTQQQSLLGAFLFLVPAVTLSGFATPIANMPVIVQKFTIINPFRYFLVVVREVFLEGAGTGLLINQYWPMAIIGVLTLTVAAWMFRHRMY
ncbi:MAG: ABC transporter permease [Dissulfurimicrobium sp.]|uniref:ABC transporter permease n=1 Tax=Dissulfurimicrobium sp. TaxID=2022436 RepID=UPI00404A54E5